MRRGDVWVLSRLGRDRKVVVVGNDGVTAEEATVLVVPISESMSPDAFGPTVCDANGKVLGVARVPGVGLVDRAALTSRAGELAPASLAFVDIALRAALDRGRLVEDDEKDRDASRPRLAAERL